MKKTLFGIQYNDYEKPYTRNFDQWNNPIHYKTTLNMETKKKINWARIWQIIQAIVTAILAGELATRSL